MKKAYVVSADIRLLLAGWANQNHFSLPSDRFFEELRGNFSRFMRQIFLDFEMVSEDEITGGIHELVKYLGLPVISLDRVYCGGGLNLEIARMVDVDGGDKGLGRRAGTPPLIRQFKALRLMGVSEVVLVDDVIYSGDLMGRVVGVLTRLGIKVPFVCAGITIREGKQKIESLGVEVKSVRIFDQVIDEVCERDFYPGVPLCGRLLAGGENIGVPYLLPFGNPKAWASIPENWVVRFSRFCLEQTISLFGEIERNSHRRVHCSDLSRKVIGLIDGVIPFTEALSKIL